jgi:hypothetical protein
MNRAVVMGSVLAVLALLVVLAAGRRDRESEAEPGAAAPPVDPASYRPTQAPEHRGFLYGRITSDDGTVYQGRLRFGGDEEAFWGDHFNGRKKENPWIAFAPPERFSERRSVGIFGIEIAGWERRIDVDRPFVSRFGDISRIEADGRDLRVRLKSGTLFELDRFAADDLADGLRVWDANRGVVDLSEWQIRTVELLPTAPLDVAPDRLRGTVTTRQGSFTGFIQWGREARVATDDVHVRSVDGELDIRFDTIRSIARHSGDHVLVSLRDGREVVLSDIGEPSQRHGGVHVDDRRYGRVVVSWDAFERLELSPGGSGPGFDGYPPGRALTGSVTTRDGRRLGGRLVYDLDEGETTETLDARFGGVNFTIPFGLIASIVLPDSDHRAELTLHGGEKLRLERALDLGGANAGILVFTDDAERPGYVRWPEVRRIDFDRPRAMYPPLAGP